MIAPIFPFGTLLWIYLFSFLQTSGKIYAVYVLFNLNPGKKLGRVVLSSFILNTVDFITIDILRIPLQLAMAISVLMVIICSKYLYRLPKTQALIVGIAMPTVQTSIQAIFGGLFIHYKVFDHTDFMCEPLALNSTMGLTGISLFLLYRFLYSKKIYLEVIEGKGRNKKIEFIYILVLTLAFIHYQFILFLLPSNSQFAFSLVFFGFMCLFCIYKMNRDMLQNKYNNYRLKKKIKEITLKNVKL